MNPDKLYDYPIWAVATLVIGGAVLGAMGLELAARFILPLDRQRMHNEVAAAIFSVVGVLYAVLLAFIAMIVWEGFNAAKAASFREAAAIAEVWQIAADLPNPPSADLRQTSAAYVHTVIGLEWPVQVRGGHPEAGVTPLAALQHAAAVFRPVTPGDINLHMALLTAISHLGETRAARLLAAETTMPTVAWAVMLFGGAIVIAFASFLRAPSLAMHLAMSAALALSGALVLVLIVALNNPFRGDFRVSTEPFDRVLAHMHAVASGADVSGPP